MRLLVRHQEHRIDWFQCRRYFPTPKEERRQRSSELTMPIVVDLADVQQEQQLMSCVMHPFCALLTARPEQQRARSPTNHSSPAVQKVLRLFMDRVLWYEWSPPFTQHKKKALSLRAFFALYHYYGLEEASFVAQAHPFPASAQVISH